MNKLGAHFTCFNETNAVKHSIEMAKKIYPEMKIRLFSEGLDFSFLEKEYSGIKTSVEQDYIGDCVKIQPHNFHGENKKKVYSCALDTLGRLEKSCEHCDSEFLIMLDPDAIIRGKLNIPENAQILGSRINTHLSLAGTNRVLSRVKGATSVDCWGATPGIFRVETLRKALTLFKNDDTLLKDIANDIHAIYAHDLLLPVLFASQGFKEQFNPDITECYRHSDWATNKKPLLHQFKFLYK